MKIIVSGPVCATWDESGEIVDDVAVLRTLDGLRHDEDVCANHLYDRLLNDISISGGAVQIAYDEQRGNLRVVSEYWSPVPLSADQLEVLIDQTQGQWSDGIGEGCFDEWSNENGITLDLAPFSRSDEKPVADQIEDGRPAPRFAHLPKAVWDGRHDIVQQAVASGEDLDFTYDGYTALCLALSRRDLKSALMLIEGGADVNRAPPYGETPLMMCADLEQAADGVTIAQALIQKGADVQAQSHDGTTALAKAKNQDRDQLVAVLTAAGARQV